MKRMVIAIAGVILMGGVAGFSVMAHTTTYASASHLTTKRIAVIEVSGRYSFSPKVTTVKVGTQVRWTNTTDALHTVTSTSSNWSLLKPPFGHGKTMAFTFKSRGTYHYYCMIHPYMKGTIKVTK